MRFGIDQKNEKLTTPGLPGTGLVPLGLVKNVSALKRMPFQCRRREPGKWPPVRMAVTLSISLGRIEVYGSVRSWSSVPGVSRRSNHSSSGAPTMMGHLNVRDQSAQVE